jgi:hypothetical protein
VQQVRRADDASQSLQGLRLLQQERDHQYRGLSFTNMYENEEKTGWFSPFLFIPFILPEKRE